MSRHARGRYMRGPSPSAQRPAPTPSGGRLVSDKVGSVRFLSDFHLSTHVIALIALRLSTSSVGAFALRELREPARSMQLYTR